MRKVIYPPEMDGYRVQLASDVRHDAIALELWDSQERLVMEVWETDDDAASRLLRVQRAVDVPMAVINWFLAEAERRLQLRDDPHR
ncbi:MAG TPA: hypothetical protein VHL52_04085 [Acidimicrobiia bacterium]|nr:hypothetical protein [Acidimicrobiia bacterium]